MLKFKSTFFKFANSFYSVDCPKMEKMRSRLLYQSKKRGILENDILIGYFLYIVPSKINNFSGFAEENLNKMNDSELEQFDKIINGKYMEWDLYYFFTGFNSFHYFN
jgi:succinate dehydrogenase assembly factor 2